MPNQPYDRRAGSIAARGIMARERTYQRTDPRPEIFSAALADQQGCDGAGKSQHQDARSRDGDQVD